MMTLVAVYLLMECLEFLCHADWGDNGGIGITELHDPLCDALKECTSPGEAP